MIQIIGKNIILEEINKSELEIVRKWRNIDRIRKQFYSQEIITKEQQKKWFNKYFKENDSLFLIMKDENNIPFGTISIYNIDNKNKNAEIGKIMIGEDKYLCRGYAKEAIDILVKYGFDTLKLHRIYLGVFTKNKTAINVYKKCGFKEEGILRKAILTENGREDILMMGILNE
jgi:UDP-4-amino-4,6-dideoxy-N-acetyl-beta-L-altrosamine N-acetyltransferase